MLGRRRINNSAPVRSSLSNAAFAVEERVVWGGVDALRGGVDALRWPFERAVWAIERGLVWPLEERTGDWGEPLRAAGVAALALFAVGAGVLGLLWASGSGGSTQQAQRGSAPATLPNQAPKLDLAQAAPALHGTAPDFTPAGTGGVSSAAGTTATKAAGEAGSASASSTSEASTAIASTSSAQTTAAAKIVPAGPAATKVALRFAGAFVLYETGQNSPEVRTAFAGTATPRLAHSLLRRPPRLPAKVEVPKAKVLNVVPGPKHGDTYTLSVSLLRVGATSELRLEMQRDTKTSEWQVTHIRG